MTAPANQRQACEFRWHSGSTDVQAVATSGGMDQVREFDRILNKEDRNIVSDKIPIPFLCIELDSKSADITGKVGRTFTA